MGATVGMEFGEVEVGPRVTGAGEGDRGTHPLKVLHIAAPGTIGGLESVLLALALGLRQTDLQVEVAAVVHSDPDDHSVVRALREGGVRVHPVVIPPRAYVRERRALSRIIEALLPDVVHTHGHRPDVLDSGLARRRGIPTVTTIHGSSYQSWQTALYEWMQFRMLRRFDVVVPVSRPLARALRSSGVPANRLEVVPNAWDGRVESVPRDEARRILGLPEDAWVAGWVGRLIPVKGADVFLHAVASIRDVPLHASIIGDGPRRRSLEALARTLGIEDRVHFHGSMEDAARLFRAFDVWVLSSRSEGTPMVLFEAMAAEVPIVAARVGGVGDVVTEAEAVLVPPEEPVALGRGVREALVRGKATSERVSTAARKLDQSFGAEAWVSRYIEIYRRVSSEPR